MVDWLLERAAKTKGSGDDLKAFQAGIAVTAMKLAKQDQLPGRQSRGRSLRHRAREEGYKLAEGQVKACGDRAACYVASIQKPENQDQNSQFSGMKDGYMIAILGNDGYARRAGRRAR